MRKLLPLLAGLALLVALLSWYARRGNSAHDPSAPARPAQSEASAPAAPAQVEHAPESQARQALEPGNETAAEPASAVAAGTAVGFELHVRGRCVDVLSQPLAGIEVRCWLVHLAPALAELEHTREYTGFPAGQEPRATSDAQGEFELVLRPAKGADAGAFEARLWIEGRGRARAAASPRFARGTPGDAGTIVLPFACTLRGSVVDGRGGAVAGASVRAGPSAGWTRSEIHYEAEPVRSSSDGSFELVGVAPGKLDLRASTNDRRDSPREALELAEGETREGLRLVLPALDDPSWISGVVLTPDGQPAPRARLTLLVERGPSRSRTSTSADAQGAFRFALAPPAQAELQAEDHEERFGGVRLEHIAPGTHGLRVQLGERRVLVLRVESTRGRIEGFGWVLRLHTGEHSTQEREEVRQAPRPEGRAELVPPLEPFSIELRAQGFQTQELGPFDPRSLPGEIVFRLEPALGIRGLVRDARGPRADVELELWRALEPGRGAEVEGLPARMLPRLPELRCRSAADGRFLLPVDRAGLYHVSARAAEFAPTVSGAIEYAPERGLEGLELVLGRGGTLEGRVYDAAGAPRAGVWLAASDGWPPVQSVQSAGDGSFGFEHLAPGGYRLFEVERALPRHPQGWSEGDPQPGRDGPADCLVREGETTRFDLRPSAPAELVLQLGRGLAALGAWSEQASLVTRGQTLGGKASWNAAHDELRLEFAAAGSARLFLALPSTPTRKSALTLIREFELGPGTSRFTLDPALGALRGSLALGRAGTPRVWLQARLPDGLQVHAQCEPDAGGGFALAALPAGSYSLSSSAGARRSVEVRAGETLAVDGF